MQKRVLPLSVVILLLSACEPMNPPSMQKEPEPAVIERAPTSELPAIETEDDVDAELDVTPEPFAEPGMVASSTGTTLKADESLAAGTLVIGDGDAAALSMTIFLHPLSPYSQDFQRLLMPKLIKEYVEPGRLAIQLVMLPINKYPGTDDAVRTLMCGIDQGKGYAVHERMFDQGATTLGVTDVAELDLDPSLFATCLSTMTGDLLTGPRSLAEQWKATLVPTYVIRGETFVGLPTEADLKGAIEAAL